MEELYELRQYITAGQYTEALRLLDEMEDMSRDDKINRVASCMEILLLYLIKQAAERTTTRAWDVSIRHALHQIRQINRRRRTHGWYLTPAELLAALEDAYACALDAAALDIFGGKWTAEEISATIDREAIISRAFEYVQHANS
jgi:hypothetical protein